MYSDVPAISSFSWIAPKLLHKTVLPHPQRRRVPHSICRQSESSSARFLLVPSSRSQDGLRPAQLVTELTACPEVSSRFATAIKGLVNFHLRGTSPDQVQIILFGGTLMTLQEKSGTYAGGFQTLLLHGRHFKSTDFRGPPVKLNQISDVAMVPSCGSISPFSGKKSTTTRKAIVKYLRVNNIPRPKKMH